jgi:hypothetical protein
MSSFLGIAYNKWHGVLGALVSFAGIISSIWWLDVESLQAHFLLAVAISTVINMLLQLWNEWFQLTSEDAPGAYQTWKNARANSRDDMKWWILGWVGGTFVGVIVLTLIDKLGGF